MCFPGAFLPGMLVYLMHRLRGVLRHECRHQHLQQGVLTAHTHRYKLTASKSKSVRYESIDSGMSAVGLVTPVVGDE